MSEMVVDRSFMLQLHYRKEIVNAPEIGSNVKLALIAISSQVGAKICNLGGSVVIPYNTAN